MYRCECVFVLAKTEERKEKTPLLLRENESAYFLLSYQFIRSYDNEKSLEPVVLIYCERMSEAKSKKALKLKTLDEIKNDTVYEIHLFPRKRRPPMKFCAPVGASALIAEEDVGDEHSLEDQVSSRRSAILPPRSLFWREQHVHSFRWSPIRTMVATIRMMMSLQLATINW